MKPTDNQAVLPLCDRKYQKIRVLSTAEKKHHTDTKFAWKKRYDTIAARNVRTPNTLTKRLLDTKQLAHVATEYGESTNVW